MINKEIKYEGKFLRLINNNSWEYVERTNCNGAVVIISMNKKNEVLLVEQFRQPVAKNVIEFPAGLISDSGVEEKAEVAALRELEEETGYIAEKITFLTSGPTAPGLSTEMISFVLAEGLEKVSEGGGVESESIIIHEVPINKIDTWLKHRQQEGKLVDLKVYGGLYFLRDRTSRTSHAY